MWRLLRIIPGIILSALLLYAATQAVEDCPTSLFVYDNCLWLWVRETLGLPQSKVARALVLEVIGLALLVGLYATFRYVFPPFRRLQLPSDESKHASSDRPDIKDEDQRSPDS